MPTLIYEAWADGGGLSILLGMTGIACVIAWPFLRCLRQAVAVQSVGATAFALYFASLGASTAAVVCGMSLAQLLIILMVRNRRLRLVFSGASVIGLTLLTILTWSGLPSLLAASGSIVNMIARNQQSSMRMKATFLIGAPFWLVHNIIVAAPLALTVDIVSILSNVTGVCLMKFGRPGRVKPASRDAKVAALSSLRRRFDATRSSMMRLSHVPNSRGWSA